MQDWLLKCTHIARLTGYMCPDMADLQRRHMEKVHPFGQLINLFSPELFSTSACANYHNKDPVGYSERGC